MIGDANTRPFELRTTIDLLQHLTLDAFSPSGRETAMIGDLGDFMIESRLMKMISPSRQIHAERKLPPKSDTG